MQIKKKKKRCSPMLHGFTDNPTFFFDDGEFFFFFEE